MEKMPVILEIIGIIFLTLPFLYFDYALILILGGAVDNST